MILSCPFSYSKKPYERGAMLTIQNGSGIYI